MMARRFVAAGVMTAFMFVGIASVNAQELTLTEEDMQYNAGKATVDADGDMSDWSNFPFKKAIPFQTGAGIGDGELVLFQNWGAGTWDGPEDHTSAVAFAWDTDNLYIGIVVTDDSHQNGGGAPAQAWNGDGVQAVFANAEQDTVTFLYNLAMNDGGDLLIHNERGPGGVELEIVRDDDTGTTSYEMVFPAASLEVDAFESGMEIGIGLCVNDGDEAHPGQTGWSGWGPHAAVTGGKHPTRTGLVTLTAKHDAIPGGGQNPLLVDLVAHFPLDADGDSADGEFTASTVTDVTFGGEGATGNTGTSANFNGSSSV
ncbi:uncharacterized protein METZ01_LOCUS245738, partial [marine metagenome]